MADNLQRAYQRSMTSPATAHVTDEVWEALAMHELPADAREAAITHIIACHECTSVYRSLQELERGARALDGSVPSPQSAQPTVRAWYALAATFAVIVAGAIGYRSLLPAPTPPPATAQAPAAVIRPAIPKAEIRLRAGQSLPTRSRDSSAAFLGDFARAITPYREDRYSDAARALDELATKYPNEYEPRYYQGVSLLLAGQAADAIPALEKAETLAPDAAKAEIQQYLALAHEYTRQR